MGQKSSRVARDLPAPILSASPSPATMNSAHQPPDVTGPSTPPPTDPVHQPHDAGPSDEGEYSDGSSDSDDSNQQPTDQTGFEDILWNLSVEVEESEQLSLLTELCQLLSFCGDSPVPSPTADSLSPVLVRLAGNETNPDVMLLAIRAITYLCDQSRPASGFLVRDEVLPVLCQRLTTIEYLDVAEQCLQALEKISLEQPKACLKSGAIMAVLFYIDFFSMSAQRVALSSVVNMCSKLSSKSSSLFMDAIPILLNLIQYEDKQLVESVATCLMTIVEKVYSSPKVLDEICNQGLVQHTLHLISMNTETTLCQSTYIGLIGLLVKLVSGSTVASTKLFELEISRICKEMLSDYCVSHGILSTPVVDGLLTLLNGLLSTTGVKRVNQQMSFKEALLLRHPDVPQSFGVDLLPTLIQVVNSGVNLSTCYGCLTVVNKLVHRLKSDVLRSSLQTANLPSFLAGVFMRKDRHVTLPALQIVDSVMLKLPRLYLNSFAKEGVVFAIYELLSPDKHSKLGSASSDVHRCPCFTFELGQSSNSPEKGACKIQDTTTLDLAKRIWITYFEVESVNPEKGVTDILPKLKTLSAVLTDLVDKSLEEDIYDRLHQIISELKEKDSISDFEFVESGIMKSLVKVFAGKQDIMEKRFEVVGRLLLSGADTAQEELPLLMMIRRLQSVLSSSEKFPVVSNHKNKHGEFDADVSHENGISHKFLRVQLVRENGEACICDYAEGVVHVKPFVPLKEVEGYLRNRVSTESNEDTSTELLLYLEGQQLNPELSLYQSIIRQQNEAEHDFTLSTSFWTRLYKIQCRRAKSSHAECSLDGAKRGTFSGADIEKLGPVYDALSLLKIMERINRSRYQLVSSERTRHFAEGKINDLDKDKLSVLVNEIQAKEFVNKKLTEKLEQQMSDPMSVSVRAMPAWCTQLMECCPFLFGFETRRSYFHLAALSSSVSKHQNNAILPRERILVDRDKILESATKMMNHHASYKAPVEVEYAEEVGTGLGPTLEFYTLVCREFQISGLGMWRDEIRAENSVIIASDFGLFPRPWSSRSVCSEVIEKFSLLGYIAAKALQDGRVLDLPLSKAFYKLVLEEELTLCDIQSFDPDLGRALLEFRAIVEKREYLRSLKSEENSIELDVLLHKMRIEDLCLDFTLPGYPDYALSSDSKMVTPDNLGEYVTLVVDAITKSGVVRQVEAFKSGFERVFPIRHLKVFRDEELECLLCGEHVPWTKEELLEHIKFDHGYTSSSPPIVNLLEIMQELDSKQQRAFLQFATGAPRLPTGGLASLSPKLTVVRKHCSDVELPSVMTCANYLKLPPYSSKEVMKGKLLYAISEGQGAFHLS